jgi:2-oxo-3-(phosphooxy)propyl 3-oxoalkanoate synthase
MKAASETGTLQDEATFAPTFDRTIPRKLVHKAGPEAVWLTDVVRVGEHRHLCAGQVPRAHTFVNDAIPPRFTYYDVGFLTELGRQAGISTMHQFEGAPVDWATVFLKFDLQLEEPVPNDRTPGPVPAVVSVEFRNHEYEEGSLTVFTEMTYEIDGVVRARSTSLAAAYEKAPYTAWRQEMRSTKPLGEHPVPAVAPITPERVGRRDPDNVMIGELRAGESPGNYRCQARIDQLHPHFFEHPMDHVPGVVHVEVLRQAAIAAAVEHHDLSPVGATIMSCSTRFAGFAELELPVDAHIEVKDPKRQTDETVDVAVRLTLAQPGDPTVTSARMVVRASRAA